MVEEICNNNEKNNDSDNIEILFSAVGLYKDKLIDLLNLEQDINETLHGNLKIKRDETTGIIVENLIQMGIKSIN